MGRGGGRGNALVCSVSHQEVEGEVPGKHLVNVLNELVEQQGSRRLPATLDLCRDTSNTHKCSYTSSYNAH